MDFEKLVEEMSLECSKPDELEPDTAKCGDCRWKGPISECGRELESEGWEYPSYWVDICPKCGYAIEEYTISDKAWKLYVLSHKFYIRKYKNEQNS